MAARRDDDDDDGGRLLLLSDAMCLLSVDDRVRSNGLGLDGDARAKKLNEIENDYESVFSWNVKRLTGISQNLMADLIDVAREKMEIVAVEDGVFSFNRFYLQLIICYELYVNGNYKESLLEIENIVRSLETCKFEDSNYSDACYHIACSTNAYVSLTLNLDSEKIMKDVKPVKSLNQVEKAAICAIKSRVFMEYPPKGNDIGLAFADQARNLQSTEPEWIIIWLKAKGRVRRYHDKYQMPDKHEIEAAKMLCATKTAKSRSLIQASKLYLEVAFNHKRNNNPLSRQFYQLSSDLSYKAIQLTNNDIKQLQSCFMTCINYPLEFQSKTILDEVVKVLSSVKNNGHIDQVLGKYYLKHKDYERAKMYLSRGMAAGHFSCSLQLVKVECLLKSVYEYPFVKTLDLICEVFPSPKRRLIVLSQILMYYCFKGNNPTQLMHYLKMYMDQDIDDKLKQHHLFTAYPLFETNGYFRGKNFLHSLSSEVKYIKSHHKWSTEEKIIIDHTFKQFNDMMNAKTSENQVHIIDNKNDDNKQLLYNDSKKNYFNKNSNTNPCTAKDESSWRKKQVGSSEIDYSKSNNQHLPSTSETVMPNKTYKKYVYSKRESSVFQNKKPGNNF